MNHTYQKNKILCILQVRGGSKGVPKKNIREVNGKPLMTWTIESAKKSGVFDGIWVSSDSDEILEVGIKEKVDTIKRPEELSGDEVLSVDSLHWAVDNIEKQLTNYCGSINILVLHKQVNILLFQQVCNLTHIFYTSTQS